MPKRAWQGLVDLALNYDIQALERLAKSLEELKRLVELYSKGEQLALKWRIEVRKIWVARNEPDFLYPSRILWKLRKQEHSFEK